MADGLRNSLGYFTEKILGWKIQPHQQNWVKLLTRIPLRLMILAPREHGKTWFFGYGYPAWWLIRDPNVRILYMTASDSKATEQVTRLRRIIENDPLKKWFGDIASDRDQWTFYKLYRKRTLNFSEPSFQGIGLHSDIIGGHFDIIIYDDLFDEEDIATDDARKKLEARFFGDLQGLTTPNSQVIVIGTRKHWADLYQKLLESPAWTKLEQKAIIKYPERWDYLPDGSGVEVHGEYEALWPARWNIQSLLLKRREMGELFFEREYQNNPSFLKGQVFKDEWLSQEGVEYDSLPENLGMVQFWDLAISENPEANYTVCVTLAIHDYQVGSQQRRIYYIADMLWAHLDFPSQCRQLRIQHDAYPNVYSVGVEAVSYQRALVQWATENGLYYVMPIMQVKNKTLRLQALSPFFENAQIKFPKGQFPWKQQFRREYLEFPEGEHDDILDALEGALTLASKTNLGKPGFVSYQ